MAYQLFEEMLHFDDTVVITRAYMYDFQLYKNFVRSPLRGIRNNAIDLSFVMQGKVVTLDAHWLCSHFET